MLPLKNILEACSRTAMYKMAIPIRGPARSWESRNFGKESVIFQDQAENNTLLFVHKTGKLEN